MVIEGAKGVMKARDAAQKEYEKATKQVEASVQRLAKEREKHDKEVARGKDAEKLFKKVKEMWLFISKVTRNFFAILSYFFIGMGWVTCQIPPPARPSVH